VKDPLLLFLALKGHDFSRANTECLRFFENQPTRRKARSNLIDQ